MRKLGIPPENLQPNRYVGPKANLVPCVEAKRRPSTLDRSYPLLTLWRVESLPTTGSEGEVWQLVKFETSPAGDATWRRLDYSGAGPGLDTITVNSITAPGVNPVDPDGVGDISILGTVVANHTVPIETHSRSINGLNIELQVAKDRTAAPADALDAGICSFDDSAFVVSGDGYVMLAGGLGPAIDSNTVDFLTAPGVNPVVPDGAGIVSIRGSTVLNGTNMNAPVATHTRGINEFHVDVQLSTNVAGSPGDPFDVGLCSFETTQFSVDANGHVTLAGAGIAIDEIMVQNDAGTGVNPVVSSATGLMSVSGGAVVNAGIPLQTITRAVNEYDIEVQVSKAIAAAPANKLDAGICSFDSAVFAVDAEGFVTQTAASFPATGSTSNLGIKYASPTFTLTSADLTALSASNPGFVTIPYYGQQYTHKIESDITFDDDSGTSDLTGNTFGTTAAVAWADSCPFYLYAVTNTTDATFMIARIPHLTLTPVAGKIAKSGSGVADSQGSMFCIDSTVTVANFASKPCTVLGCFRMAKNDAANDDWTVTAIDYRDGIERFHLGTNFNMPLNQNGATSSGLSSSVGGNTIPTFASVANNYNIDMAGKVSYFYGWNNTSVSGIGAGILRFHVPLETGYFSSWYSPPGNFRFRNNAASNYQTGIPFEYSLLKYFEVIKSGAAQAKMTPAGITTDKSNGALTVYYMTGLA